MGRSLENRLDKQTESQKPGTNFPIEKDTTTLPNSQIRTDNESEMKKPPVSEKAEQQKSERNGIKPKTTNPWKNNEVQNGATKGTNGNTTQLVHSDSLDIKTTEKFDSPMSASTPNDSSEISSQSESPLIQDDTKSKNHIALPTTSEDEVPTIVENIENNRVRKRRRWDVRGENGNEENGSMSVGNNKSEGMLSFFIYISIK